MSTDKYEHKHDLKASPHHFCLYHLLLFAQVPLSHHEHRETFLCYHLTNGLRTFLIFLPKKLRRNIQKIFPKTMSFQRIWDNVPNQQNKIPCTCCAFSKSNCWCTECKRKGFKKPITILNNNNIDDDDNNQFWGISQNLIGSISRVPKYMQLSFYFSMIVTSRNSMNNGDSDFWPFHSYYMIA